MLLNDRMPKAEVTLRLAMYLIKDSFANHDVICGIDGALLKVGGSTIIGLEALKKRNTRLNHDAAITTM
ncbi:hypothetical protein AB4341_18710 [Vibrio breoganii]